MPCYVFLGPGLGGYAIGRVPSSLGDTGSVGPQMDIGLGVAVAGAFEVELRYTNHAGISFAGAFSGPGAPEPADYSPNFASLVVRARF